MLGAYLVAKLARRRSASSARCSPAAGACAVVAALIDVVLVRPLRRRRGGIDTLAILTIGVNIVLATELDPPDRHGHPARSAPRGARTTAHAPRRSPCRRRASPRPIVAIVLMVAFFAAFKFSDWGVAMRVDRRGPGDRGADGHPAVARRRGRVGGERRRSPRSPARSSRASRRPASTHDDLPARAHRDPRRGPRRAWTRSPARSSAG